MNETTMPAVESPKAMREQLTRGKRLRLAGWHFRCAFGHLWAALKGKR